MPETSPESAEPASGAWIVFARAWYGLADSFPFERFDDFQDEELPAALQQLAREHVDQNGGEQAWRAAAIMAELKSAEARHKIELARHRGRSTPPSGRGKAIGPPGPPTKQELEDHLAAAFDAGGVALFDAVAGPADWRAPRSHIISGNPHTYQPAVYLLECLSAKAARLVSQRLNELHSTDLATCQRWRFGCVDMNKLTDIKRVIVKGSLNDPHHQSMRYATQDQAQFVREALAAETPVGRVRVDCTRNVVSIDGTPVGVTADQARIVHIIVAADGAWVTSSSLKQFKGSQERPDRIIKNLPKEVRRIIDSKRSAGYRLLLLDPE